MFENPKLKRLESKLMTVSDAKQSDNQQPNQSTSNIQYTMNGSSSNGVSGETVSSIYDVLVKMSEGDGERNAILGATHGTAGEILAYLQSQSNSVNSKFKQNDTLFKLVTDQLKSDEDGSFGAVTATSEFLIRTPAKIVLNRYKTRSDQRMALMSGIYDLTRLQLSETMSKKSGRVKAKLKHDIKDPTEALMKTSIATSIYKDVVRPLMAMNAVGFISKQVQNVKRKLGMVDDRDSTEIINASGIAYRDSEEKMYNFMGDHYPDLVNTQIRASYQQLNVLTNIYDVLGKSYSAATGFQHDFKSNYTKETTVRRYEAVGNIIISEEEYAKKQAKMHAAIEGRIARENSIMGVSLAGLGRKGKMEDSINRAKMSLTNQAAVGEIEIAENLKEQSLNNMDRHANAGVVGGGVAAAVIAGLNLATGGSMSLLAAPIISNLLNTGNSLADLSNTNTMSTLEEVMANAGEINITDDSGLFDRSDDDRSDDGSGGGAGSGLLPARFASAMKNPQYQMVIPAQQQLLSPGVGAIFMAMKGQNQMEIMRKGVFSNIEYNTFGMGTYLEKINRQGASKIVRMSQIRDAIIDLPLRMRKIPIPVIAIRTPEHPGEVISLSGLTPAPLVVAESGVNSLNPSRDMRLIVGEGGPELITFNDDGTINVIRNSDLAGEFEQGNASNRRKIWDRDYGDDLHNRNTGNNNDDISLYELLNSLASHTYKIGLATTNGIVSSISTLTQSVVRAGAGNIASLSSQSRLLSSANRLTQDIVDTLDFVGSAIFEKLSGLTSTITSLYSYTGDLKSINMDMLELMNRGVSALEIIQSNPGRGLDTSRGSGGGSGGDFGDRSSGQSFADLMLSLKRDREQSTDRVLEDAYNKSRFSDAFPVEGTHDDMKKLSEEREEAREQARRARELELAEEQKTVLQKLLDQGRKLGAKKARTRKDGSVQSIGELLAKAGSGLLKVGAIGGVMMGIKKIFSHFANSEHTSMAQGLASLIGDTSATSFSDQWANYKQAGLDDSVGGEVLKFMGDNVSKSGAAGAAIGLKMGGVKGLVAGGILGTVLSNIIDNVADDNKKSEEDRDGLGLSILNGVIGKGDGSNMSLLNGASVAAVAGYNLGGESMTGKIAGAVLGASLGGALSAVRADFDTAALDNGDSMTWAITKSIFSIDGSSHLGAAAKYGSMGGLIGLAYGLGNPIFAIGGAVVGAGLGYAISTIMEQISVRKAEGEGIFEAVTNTVFSSLPMVGSMAGMAMGFATGGPMGAIVGAVVGGAVGWVVDEASEHLEANGGAANLDRAMAKGVVDMLPRDGFSRSMAKEAYDKGDGMFGVLSAVISALALQGVVGSWNQFSRGVSRVFSMDDDESLDTDKGLSEEELAAARSKRKSRRYAEDNPNDVKVQQAYIDRMSMEDMDRIMEARAVLLDAGASTAYVNAYLADPKNKNVTKAMAMKDFLIHTRPTAKQSTGTTVIDGRTKGFINEKRKITSDKHKHVMAYNAAGDMISDYDITDSSIKKYSGVGEKRIVTNVTGKSNATTALTTEAQKMMSIKAAALIAGVGLNVSGAATKMDISKYDKTVKSMDKTYSKSTMSKYRFITESMVTRLNNGDKVDMIKYRHVVMDLLAADALGKDYKVDLGSIDNSSGDSKYKLQFYDNVKNGAGFTKYKDDLSGALANSSIAKSAIGMYNSVKGKAIDIKNDIKNESISVASNIKSKATAGFTDFANSDRVVYGKDLNGKEISLPRDIDAMIDRVAKEQGVDPNMLKSFAFTESSGDPNANSDNGKKAKGLMQFFPYLGKHYGLIKDGVDNRFDPELSTRAVIRSQSEEVNPYLKRVGLEGVSNQYLYHQQGSNGFRRLAELAKNGKRATGKARSFMDANGGKGMEASEFLNAWRNKMNHNTSVIANYKGNTGAIDTTPIESASSNQDVVETKAALKSAEGKIAKLESAALNVVTPAVAPAAAPAPAPAAAPVVIAQSPSTAKIQAPGSSFDNTSRAVSKDLDTLEQQLFGHTTSSLKRNVEDYAVGDADLFT